ncbi:hypothetical protein [Nocardioides xinjiangensis]|uniref:hypothetical protein n=1 Tax=Nocardioides xinjiangensis TaxID=2817376 RepID=UPI001B306A30|nr:hypothetical protein [Nocardioides sp. SYSU D00778]
MSVRPAGGGDKTPSSIHELGELRQRPGTGSSRTGVVAMADSTWFTDGLGDLYGERPEGHLPLADAGSIDEVRDAMVRGGLVDVTVTPLHDVLELDRAHGVAPGHEVRLQHLLVGRRG